MTGRRARCLGWTLWIGGSVTALIVAIVSRQWWIAAILPIIFIGDIVLEGNA